MNITKQIEKAKDEAEFGSVDQAYHHLDEARRQLHDVRAILNTADKALENGDPTEAVAVLARLLKAIEAKAGNFIIHQL